MALPKAKGEWDFDVDLTRHGSIARICKFIKRYMDADGMTMKEVADSAGVSYPTASRYYHGEVKHPWMDKMIDFLVFGLGLEVHLMMRPRGGAVLSIRESK